MGFDSLAGTVTEVPLRSRVMAWLLAFVATASLAVVLAGPPGVVEAQTNCDGVIIPIDALAGSTVGSAATGAMLTAPINLGTTAAPVVIAQGGAAVAAGTAVGVGVSGLALGAAAAYATMRGTCTFLDWTGWLSGEQFPQLATQENTTMGDQEPCLDMMTRMGATAPAVPTTDRCIEVSFSSSAAQWDSYDTFFANLANGNTRGGVTIPRVTVATYPNYGEFGSQYQSTFSWLNASRTTWCGSGTSVSGCLLNTPVSRKLMGIRISCGSYDVGMGGLNIGNACGLPAGAVLSLSNYSNANAAWEYVNPLAPKVQQFGWQRRLVTNVRCSGGLDFQKETPLFYDKAVTERIEYPKCPAGQFAKRIVTQRVPANVPCLPANVTCWGVDGQISYWLAPTSWDVAGTRPSFVDTCLTVGSTCGAPQLQPDGVTCLWGGAAITAAACELKRQTSTVESPGTTSTDAGTVTGVVTATSSTGTRSTTYTAPTTATTVPGTTVPGGGTGTGTGSSTDLLEVIDVSGNEASCLPTGWGKFNPISWVLEPVKCAITWAFIPDQAALDLRLTALEALTDDPPVQWATEGIGYVQGVSLGFDTWASAGPACFTVMSTEVCPRTWDQSSQAPTWLVSLMALGLWLVVIVGVWRFF